MREKNLNGKPYCVLLFHCQIGACTEIYCSSLWWHWARTTLISVSSKERYPAFSHGLSVSWSTTLVQTEISTTVGCVAMKFGTDNQVARVSEFYWIWRASEFFSSTTSKLKSSLVLWNISTFTRWTSTKFSTTFTVCLSQDELWSLDHQVKISVCPVLGLGPKTCKTNNIPTSLTFTFSLVLISNC